ncbi:hypothetical protein IW261DRAFT_1568141 [Armillaria novae-zelandiae]|uniref:Uncharacterized protein n=1 Tax=Armillaria novae-zelandiae TaxID=153914 RepID=A0AA39P0D2_9AGAR|nr:hypothetical protein IW261DRAFT_1568141 [Armillaria novae-zelandiae]
MTSSTDTRSSSPSSQDLPGGPPSTISQQTPPPPQGPRWGPTPRLSPIAHRPSMQGGEAPHTPVVTLPPTNSPFTRGQYADPLRAPPTPLWKTRPQSGPAQLKNTAGSYGLGSVAQPHPQPTPQPADEPILPWQWQTKTQRVMINDGVDRR